jgi:hypothetical protein
VTLIKEGKELTTGTTISPVGKVIGLSSGSRDSLGDSLDGLESDILKKNRYSKVGRISKDEESK